MSDSDNRQCISVITEGDDLSPDLVIEAYKKDIDVTLVRQNLKLSVTERFEELMELQRFAEALRNSRVVEE